jgi:hypothetical protein
MSEQDLYVIRASEEGGAVHLANETLGLFGERPKAVEAAVIVAEASARHAKAAGVVLEEGDDQVPISEAGRDTY